MHPAGASRAHTREPCAGVLFTGSTREVHMKASVLARCLCMAVASPLLLAVGAQAATTAPHPITEHATGVSADSAVLHGVIATHGVKTDWQFQYGRTTAYGDRKSTRLNSSHT